MKKSFIPLIISFLAVFTAFGQQSVTITPSTENQNSVRVFGTAIPNFSGFRGGLTVGSATQSGSALLSLRGFGHNGTAFVSSGANGGISINADQDFTPTAQGTSIRFFNTNLGTTTITEKMRIDPNGNVGIGTTTPNYKLEILHGGSNGVLIKSNVASSLLDIDGFNNDAALRFYKNGDAKWLIRNIGSNDNFQIFEFGLGAGERFRIQNITGNIGIGNNSPNGKLSFENSDNTRKIVLSEVANNDHQFSGFGVNPNVARYQIPSIGHSHVFFAGTSPTNSNELMRITGLGNVGIGTTTPTAKFEVNGFTKLGTDAPAIKVKKLTSTTAASEGTNVSVAHGLTRSKIISATVLVDDGSFSNLPNSPIGGVNFYFEIDATNVIVYNSTTQSELILSKPIVIMITYEE